MSHRHVLVNLVKQLGWTQGAELGVASGQCAKLLMTECQSLSMIGVDIMARPDRAASARAVAREHPRYRLMECRTAEASGRVPNGMLDFVFIDADHSYRAVKQDIALWLPKIRRGGWMLGHDYNRDAFPGVIRAVDEAFGSRVREHEFNVWSVTL